MVSFHIQLGGSGWAQHVYELWVSKKEVLCSCCMFWIKFVMVFNSSKTINDFFGKVCGYFEPASKIARLLIISSDQIFIVHDVML